MKKFITWLLPAVLLIAGGCVSKVIEEKRMGFGERERSFYEPVKDCKLKLELPERQLTAGSAGELVFALRNVGAKPVTIREWYKYEPYNLKVECQVWLPGTESPTPGMWMSFSPEVKHPALRYTQTIQPGERLYCSVFLPFISKLIVSQGAERRYFIRAELNLTSVKSNVVEGAIAVVAPRKIAPRPASAPKK